ncbi:hypothetical protein ABBQ38_004462 [Trebouxia sp. C0009 RCD-2024]
MYNGIGILSVRGSGTSGYVQGNKFNLRGGRPLQNRFPDNTDKGPTQRVPDEDILKHNQKRNIELKLAAEEDRLLEQGLAADEVDKKLGDMRVQLEAEVQKGSVAPQTNADETHALAQRKVAQMDKLRTVFGFSQDQDKKEGEAFDRELQERRKRDRQMEIEQREKAKVKKAREAEKEKKRKEKERKRSIKKAEKENKKQEKQRQKELLQRQQQREQERLLAKAEAKKASERARAIREAPPPERYVPRGPSPARYASSESEDELPSPPPLRSSHRIASQLASRPAAPSLPAAALTARRSKSLSPDPVRAAVNHSEPPKHTVPSSPPRKVQSDRSPSPPPKRQRREDPGADYKDYGRSSRDDRRDRGENRSRHRSPEQQQPSIYPTSDRGKGYAAAPYGDRPVRSSRDDDRAPVEARYGDRDRPRDADWAPYGDRERTRGSDRGAYGDRGHHRSDYDGSRRGDERRSRPGESSRRSPGPSNRVRDVRRDAEREAGRSRRQASPSSSSTSGSSTSGSSTSGSSSSGGSSRSSGSSSSTSSSSRSRG